ncbi:recombinase family protein [Halobacteriovorax sp. HLS]|uniref:recombinase family protein n=1 Tax=Halobacteriovorax sp. HLS TaxID=2234000 RepID=UPI000FDCBFC6|nr:recombinase family protein [Halobacteriovorax sp. HLS]
MRKLYLENDLSSYEIHKKTNWSRASISDALRILEIEKVKRKEPVLSYGEKLIGTTRVVHKGEQKIIEKMLALLNEGQNFTQISKYLNNKNIPTKRGGAWHPSTVKEIIKRIQKRKV